MAATDKLLVSVLAVKDDNDPKQIHIQLGIHGIADRTAEVDFIMVKMISALASRIFGNCKSSEERMEKLLVLTPVMTDASEPFREISFDDKTPQQP